MHKQTDNNTLHTCIVYRTRCVLNRVSQPGRGSVDETGRNKQFVWREVLFLMDLSLPADGRDTHSCVI